MSFDDAVFYCKTSGCIFRQSNPGVKFYKISLYNLRNIVSEEEQLLDDWDHLDASDLKDTEKKNVKTT